MIYVVTHKPVQTVPVKRDYEMLQVGFGDDIVGSIRDNTGSNICDKNASYCELTGLYWIWKNRSDKIVGLVHYRRFFVYHLYSKIDKRIPLKYRMITMLPARIILHHVDAILPERWIVDANSVEEHWNRNHYSRDLQTVKNIIERLYPEYIDDYRSFMSQRTMYACNMFIMRRELLDSYCRFLFSILREAEKSIIVNTGSAYQQRVFGFLAERLFNVWIIHNKLKVCEMKVAFIQ